MLTLFIDSLQSLDNNLFLFFNGFHNQYWDSVNMLLTSKFIWVPLYLSLIVSLLATRRLNTALFFAASIMLMIAVTDFSISTTIRPFLGRLRPSHPDNPISLLAHNVDGYKGGTYGFPSLHSTNSFALAVFIALVARNKAFTIFIVTWAIVHSYTRLYLGVHYPGDLFVGAIIGSLVGWGFYNLSLVVRRRFTDDSGHIIHKQRYNPWYLPIIIGILTVAGALLVSI